MRLAGIIREATISWLELFAQAREILTLSPTTSAEIYDSMAVIAQVR
jgi:truncated hemoglobin YjbI